MGIKKIRSTLLLSLVVFFTYCIIGQPMIAMASEKSNNSINSNTVITEDNLNDVLNYLGIDPSGFIKTDVSNSPTVNTVGELNKIINQEKDAPIINLVTNYSNEDLTASRAAGVKYLSSEVDVETYTLTLSLNGHHNGTYWTGASGLGVTVDSDYIGMVFKVAPNPALEATYTPTTLTLNSYVTINKYMGVGNTGLVPVGYQGIKSTHKYSAHSYLNSNAYPGYAVHAGDRGAVVTQVQQRLNAIGFNLTPDGSFGPATDVALRNFQISRGLTNDGYAGSATWDALFNQSFKPAYPGYACVYGSTGKNVISIQARLNQLGYTVGAPDGSFGPKTLSELKRFQGNKGLGVDGSAGPATWKALFS